MIDDHRPVLRNFIFPHSYDDRLAIGASGGPAPARVLANCAEVFKARFARPLAPARLNADDPQWPERALWACQPRLNGSFNVRIADFAAAFPQQIEPVDNASGRAEFNSSFNPAAGLYAFKT